MQIYFFSVLFLILTGIKLSHQKFGKLLKYENIFSEGYLDSKKVSIAFAVGSAFFGLLQILQVYPPRVQPPVIGDIIPALLNVIGGLALLLRGFNISYKGEKKFLLWFQEFIFTNISIIGLLMIIFGFIHVIFPMIVLL